MDGDDLRDRATTGVLQMIASVVLHYHLATQRLGLGATGSQFLSLLDRHGSLTPGQFAELTDLSTGTVTGVLDRLQKGGFVRRMRHPDDRRKILVTPVPESKDAIALYFSEQSEHLAEVLRQRDPAELRVIAAFLADWTGGR